MNYYLAENSALIEFDSTDYGRLLSLPSRSLSQIEDLNAEEYRGFLRDFGATSSANTSYLISANCTASDNLSTGDCNIFLVSDYILPALESQRRYHINFDSELNKYSVNGLVTGKITKDTEPCPNPITNIACSANSNFRSPNKTYKLLHCNAQSAVDRSKLLHLILLKTE